MPDDSFNEFVPDPLGAKPDVLARMKKLVFVFVALAASLIAARADLVMEQQTSDTNATYHITVKVRGDKMRMDEQDGKGHAFSVIVDLNTRDSLTLMPNEKMFLKRSGAEGRQQSEAEKEAAHGANDMDNTPAAPVNTGKAEKLGGYDTEIYRWSGARGVTETLWVATNFPNYSSIRTELAKIDRFDAAGSHRNAQPQSSLLPGMVVKTERKVKEQSATITLVSAMVEPVDASLFELPANYSPWQPPALAVTNVVKTPTR